MTVPQLNPWLADTPTVSFRLPGTNAMTRARGKLEPTYKPWSINQDRRSHYVVRSQIVAHWRAGAAYAGQQWRIASGRRGHLPFTVVQCRFWLPHAEQADPHNYCGTVVKAIIDGLCKGAHFWPDDTGKFVGHRESVLTLEKILPEIWLYFDEG